jgi:tetratricopeptide (TPR) repeat protein
MTQRERLASGRIRPPYAESAEGEELDVLPRPVPKAFGRVVMAATVITLVIGALVIRARTSREPVKEPVVSSSEALHPAPSAGVTVLPPTPPPLPATPPAPSAPPPATSSPPPPSAEASPTPAEAPLASAAPSAKDLVAEAQTLLNRQSFGHAADVARRATQADPTNAEAWLMLGGAYEALGSKEKARSAYRKCAEQAKGSGARECRALLAQ